MRRHADENSPDLLPPRRTPRWKEVMTDFITAVAYTWMVTCTFILILTLIFWVFDL